MKRTICIFEDEGFKDLLPVVYTRPVYEIRCGISTLREKICAFFPGSDLVLHSRRYLEGVLLEENPKTAVNRFDAEEILFINGRLLINKESYSTIKKLETDSLLSGPDGSIIAARLTKDQIKKIHTNDSEFLTFGTLREIKVINSGITLIKYIWDAINLNGREIPADFERIKKSKTRPAPKTNSQVILKNKKDIFIGSGSVIDPFVFLDASRGPIFIGEKVHIMSHCYIQGPTFIGDESVVKKGAAIYQNTSIGRVCKVGGEIESSIIQSYSNKQHDGFLGHSYLGSWINLGAGTNNSDLRNDYENISLLLNGKKVDSGSRFVGLIMGDHSKTAINTMFNTGTIVGVSCNVFGAGFPSRYIPSFGWGGSDFLKTYDIEKALKVAATVHKRREKDLSVNEAGVLKTVFEMTADERARKNRA